MEGSITAKFSSIKKLGYIRIAEKTIKYLGNKLQRYYCFLLQLSLHNVEMCCEL